jgi:hypothetical protein
MAIRRQLLVAVLAAVLVLATVLAVRAGRTGTGEPAGQVAAPTATADATPGTGPAGKPQRRRSPAAPESTGGSSAAPDQEAAGSGSPEESDEPVLEVPDASSTTAALPGLGRDERRRAAAAAELREDFPALQVRQAALTPRHPRRNVPIPTAAEVDSSSIATADGVTHVGLVLQWPGSVDRALRFYRIQLGRIGFTEQAPPTVPAGSAVSFRRSADRVVVVAQPEGEDVVVTLHATLRTGG